MKSIIESDTFCYICANVHKRYIFDGTEEHHIFCGHGKREFAGADGLTVHLCPQCHREGPEAVHKNHLADMYLKTVAQAKYEETHTREEFLKRYGKSYL